MRPDAGNQTGERTGPSGRGASLTESCALPSGWRHCATGTAVCPSPAVPGSGGTSFLVSEQSRSDGGGACGPAPPVRPRRSADWEGLEARTVCGGRGTGASLRLPDRRHTAGPEPWPWQQAPAGTPACWLDVPGFRVLPAQRMHPSRAPRPHGPTTPGSSAARAGRGGQMLGVACLGSDARWPRGY